MWRWDTLNCKGGTYKGLCHAQLHPRKGIHLASINHCIHAATLHPSYAATIQSPCSRAYHLVPCCTRSRCCQGVAAAAVVAGAAAAPGRATSPAAGPMSYCNTATCSEPMQSPPKPGSSCTRESMLGRPCAMTPSLMHTAAAAEVAEYSRHLPLPPGSATGSTQRGGMDHNRGLTTGTDPQRVLRRVLKLRRLTRGGGKEVHPPR